MSFRISRMAEVRVAHKNLCINIVSPAEEVPEQSNALFSFQDRGMGTWEGARCDGNTLRGLHHRKLYAVLLQKTPQTKIFFQ